MPWSLRVFRIAGVGVHLHVTFLLLLALVGIAEVSATGSFLAAFLSIGFFLALFACVLAHEFGHVLMARRFGVGTHDVTLLPIGGVARLKSIPEKPRQELWVALAGPAVNVVIVGILLVWIQFFEGGIARWQFSLTHGGFAMNLMTINLIMIGFNLLPAFPMDGGRVLRAFLASRMDFIRATRIAASMGRVMAVLFVFAGLFWFKNPFLIFIAFVVWFGAGQEARYASLNSVRKKMTLGHVMIRNFQTARTKDTLSQLIDRIHSGIQTDFPVMNDQGELVGMFHAKKLLEGSAKYAPSDHVASVMTSEVKSVNVDQLLEPTLAQFRGETGVVVPVLEKGRLVGLLPVVNISETARIRQAFLERLSVLNLH